MYDPQGQAIWRREAAVDRLWNRRGRRPAAAAGRGASEKVRRRPGARPSL